MNVSKPVLLGVVLLAVNLSGIPWILNVNVMNFPLDEEGNLKVSTGETSKVVTLVKDLKMSGSEAETRYEYFSVDVEGYNEFCLFAGFRNWTCDAYYDVGVRFKADGIKAQHLNRSLFGDLRIPHILRPSTGLLSTTFVDHKPKCVSELIPQVHLILLVGFLYRSASTLETKYPEYSTIPFLFYVVLRRKQKTLRTRESIPLVFWGGQIYTSVRRTQRARLFHHTT